MDTVLDLINIYIVEVLLYYLYIAIRIYKPYYSVTCINLYVYTVRAKFGPSKFRTDNYASEEHRCNDVLFFVCLLACLFVFKKINAKS